MLQWAHRRAEVPGPDNPSTNTGDHKGEHSGEKSEEGRSGTVQGRHGGLAVGRLPFGRKVKWPRAA